MFQNSKIDLDLTTWGVGQTLHLITMCGSYHQNAFLLGVYFTDNLSFQTIVLVQVRCITGMHMQGSVEGLVEVSMLACSSPPTACHTRFLMQNRYDRDLFQKKAPAIFFFLAPSSRITGSYSGGLFGHEWIYFIPGPVRKARRVEFFSLAVPGPLVGQVWSRFNL